MNRYFLSLAHFSAHGPSLKSDIESEKCLPDRRQQKRKRNRNGMRHGDKYQGTTATDSYIHVQVRVRCQKRMARN